MDKKRSSDTEPNNTMGRELFVHNDSNESLIDPLLNIEETESNEEEEEDSSGDEQE